MSDLPVGTIVLFSGTTIPSGWRLCDGKNETPDLINKFVLGGQLEDVNGNGGGNLTGDKNNKSKIVTSTKSAVDINVSIGKTALTIEQIPAHSHSSRVSINTGTANSNWDVKGESDSGHRYQGVGLTDEWLSIPINDTGSGFGHSHAASSSDSKMHNHSTDIIQPYYILSYIKYFGVE
ncbi:phage tail protein [Yokenella regensburgei]|uniref:phage tail protein n=1 Tax=Yokenella regensburgei TaxID=158877 RepID=UPI001432B686|nr:phage tail protein [Yokenella regensburgei]QIU88413.1 tail fiber protein [Yokenella regensburgei]